MNHTRGRASLIDRYLIAGVRMGSPSAFRDLYRRHTPRLRRVISAALGADSPEIDDCLQETWLSAVRGMGGFRGDSSFSTWLHTIAIRWSYRHQRRDQDEEPLDALDEAAVGGRAEPVALRIDLDRALETLSSRDRSVLLLHDFVGHGHAEIAATLGIPEGTSKSILHRARSRMRSALEPRADE